MVVTITSLSGVDLIYISQSRELEIEGLKLSIVDGMLDDTDEDDDESYVPPSEDKFERVWPGIKIVVVVMTVWRKRGRVMKR